jgi:cytochrome b561
MALHWIMAALVVAMITLGQIMTEVPRQTPLRGTLFNLHKSLGILVLLLIMLRLGWRLRHPPPPLPTGVPSWNRQLAGATHIAFYALLILQPLLGYAASAFGEYGVAFFGIPLSSWGHEPSLREPLLDAHHLVADLLVILIGLHLLGVAWHVATRDPLWRRMWPG